MDKTKRAKALIEFYRSLNPLVVNDWNVAKEITNDLQQYLNSSGYEKLREEMKTYECDELYNESY